jgi:hypothetical protein
LSTVERLRRSLKGAKPVTFEIKTPNEVLQQTGHANNAFSRFNVQSA